LLREALEANPSVIELSDTGDEVFKGAAKAVKLPDDQAVSWPDVG
jgi:hypothetical protein